MMNDPFTHQIIAIAFKVHNALGYGFYEKVYENAMMIELRKAGIKAVNQFKIGVEYAGENVGSFKADILIEGHLLLELKANYELTSKDEVQLVNYLKATKLETGLLINFGSSVQIKRKFRDYKRQN